MARDVTIDVLMRDKTARGVSAVTSSVKKLQDKVKGATDTLSTGILGTFKGLPPQVQAVAVAAAAAIGVSMASAIGAALTAGVLLAVGGGVLAAGIKGAASSPAVQAAWKTFTARAQKAFAGFSKPFEGPVKRALETFGDTIERMAPTLKRMGASMAPVIDKLAPALAAMAEKALPGIEKALEAGKPLWDTLAEHLPMIGTAISKFFEGIAEGGPGANQFLKDFLKLMAGLIAGLGIAIGWLAKMYTKSREVWNGISRVFAEGVRVVINVLGTIIGAAATAFGWIPGIGPKLKTAAKEFAEFQKKANHEIDKITGKTVHVDVSLRGIKNLEEQVAVRLGRRAHGGPVAAGTSYLVGEKGPEILTMGASSGYVTPNHRLSSGGGDTHVTVIIDGRALDSSVVRVMSDRDRGLKRRVLAGAR
ncbi:hypothetical protein [Micromonospora arida]